jgi:hypothetical protein
MQKFTSAKTKTFAKAIYRDAVGYRCSLIGVSEGLGAAGFGLVGRLTGRGVIFAVGSEDVQNLGVLLCGSPMFDKMNSPPVCVQG